jgi:low temperature requirement protein LtrA
VLYHSNKNAKHKVYSRSIIIHMCTLLLSFIAYLVTLGVIGYNPTRGENIGKIFLWFAPMVIEILSHFYIANRVEDHIPIESEAVHKRSATLFVVILGEGMVVFPILDSHSGSMYLAHPVFVQG